MMEGVSGFSGHWLEILAAVYLVGMVLYGHYRGFIRLCVSALALVISLVTVRVALPYVTEWLKNDTPVYESIRQGMQSAWMGFWTVCWISEKEPAGMEPELEREGPSKS